MQPPSYHLFLPSLLIFIFIYIHSNLYVHYFNEKKPQIPKVPQVSVTGVSPLITLQPSVTSYLYIFGLSTQLGS
jgi:hypothetical protein